MTGLLLIAVVGLWIGVVWHVSRWATRSIRIVSVRIFARALTFAALVTCPMVDEIVGGVQFRKLCEREAVLKIDAAKVRGRTLKQIAAQSFPANTLLRIEEWRNSFVDTTSGEELASFGWLRVSGGWFIRTLGISEGNAPLLIHPATCWPVMHGRLSQTFQFTLIKE